MLINKKICNIGLCNLIACIMKQIRVESNF